MPLKESALGDSGCFVQKVFVSGWKRQKGSLGSPSSLDLHQPRKVKELLMVFSHDSYIRDMQEAL